MEIKSNGLNIFDLTPPLKKTYFNFVTGHVNSDPSLWSTLDIKIAAYNVREAILIWGFMSFLGHTKNLTGRYSKQQYIPPSEDWLWMVLREVHEYELVKRKGVTIMQFKHVTTYSEDKILKLFKSNETHPFIKRVEKKPVNGHPFNP